MSRNEILPRKKAVSLSHGADYLGISVQSLRRRIADGSLPAFRVGPKSVRVYVDDLEALKRPIGGGAA